MVRRRGGNCIEGEMRAGLVTECKGELDAFGPIRLHTPSSCKNFGDSIR